MNTPDPHLVASALLDIAPYDQGGEMAAVIKRVGQAAESARTLGIDTVSRQNLALVITGSEEACAVLSKAYAKALHGYGLVYGKGAGPVVNSIDWTDQICDNEASRTLQEHGWANTKMYEAKDEAEGGTLVIRDIHRKPYEGSPDEAESAPPAEKGGLQAISTFMTDYAEEEYIPVVVLTGPDRETRDYLAKTPELSSLFKRAVVHADAAPLTAAAYSTQLESPVALRSPLKLKARSPSPA